MMASRAVYNVLGQVKERYDAQLNKTEYFYEDANKNLTKTIDAEGHRVDLHYNALDQQDWKREYLDSVNYLETVFTYYDNGNLKTVVDPRLKTYTYNYDTSNRLVSIAYPIAGHSESWVYDADGNLFSHTDPNGKVVTYTYDDLGLAIAEQHGAPYNVTITRTYEDDLHRVTISDGAIGKVMNSNTLNRLTGVQYKIGGVPWKSVSYGYDDAGLRTSMVDPEGAQFTYAYTPNSQLASVTRNSSFVIQHSYDSGGRKIRSDLGNGTSMRYTYDIKERLTNVKAIRSQGDVVSSFSYVYNKIDNRVQMKLDHENVLVNYGYDGVSRLTSESWNLGAANPSCNNQYTAQPQGNESGFSNVARATPSAGILTSPFLSYYTYDSAGNRTAKYRLDGGSSYAVDDENRLTSEQPFSIQVLTPVTTTTQDNWVELDFGALVAPFRLDVALPDMNRRFKIQWHDGTSYQDISSGVALGATLEQDGYYRPFSQDCRFLFVLMQTTQKIRYWQESGSSAGVSLAAYTIVNGAPIAYGYDANGNQTSRTQGTSVETYAHDYANRIVTYSDQQVAYNYIFAPSGERMAKTNVGTGDSEWYMYDGDDVVADYALPSGGAYSLTATYANGLGTDSKVARFDAQGAPSYYIPDALGSVHRILDGAQHVVNTYLTNAWGESLISIEGQSNRYGFTQRERDPESGLMHYRARSYDPRLGRFVQKDPILRNRPFKHYLYAGNNPICLKDPSGLDEDMLLEDAIDAIRNGTPVAVTVGRIYFRGTEAEDILTSMGISPLTVEMVKADSNHRKWAEEEYEILTKETKYRAYAMEQNEVTARLALLEEFSGGKLSRMISDEYDFLTAANPIHFAADAGWTIGSGENLIGEERSRLGAATGFALYLIGIKAGNLVESQLASLVKAGPISGTEGTLVNAKYAQTSYRENFTKKGTEFLEKQTGSRFNTVDELANAIKSGSVDVSKVPVHYIVRDGNTLILNTRTATALERAGIPRSQWRGVDVTTDKKFEILLDGQLMNSKLSSTGFDKPVSRSSGK